MANYYDEQISHMKHLMDYGMKNESKKSQNSSVLNQKEGADGMVYGIVSEGTKYYIKSCPKGKENLTESFDYVGGFLNKKNCEYSSFANAVKDMDMKLMGLNEDYGKHMPINEMKRTADFMDESMVEMQEDIARHRQILENIDVIYQNKKGGIGDKNTGVPEAPKTQEFNTKVGDPFEDPAKYEANRDNKETAKDHERQGGPFKEDGGVDSKDMENADNLPTQDSNTPGDTYTKKAEYVPDNAVAAMNPSGGEVTRVKKINESLEETDEENHFPEENPDLGASEFGELGDPAEDLNPEDMEGMPVGDDLTDDELLSKFNDDPDDDAYLDMLSHPTEDGELPEPIDLKPADGVSNPDYKEGSHLAGDDEQIAGIDDMSGVDRNNLSAEVIDNVVNEIVGKFSKDKRMKMISESVAKSILREAAENGEEPEDDSWHDDDFMYFKPEKTPTPSDPYKSPRKGLDAYQGSRPQNRRPNLQPDGTLLDPRPGAPKDVNPDKVEYDPNSMYYLQNKYHDDDPNVPFEESGSWVDSSDNARRFRASLYRAANELEQSGKKIDADKIFTVYRHSAAVRNFGKKTIAKVLGIHPDGVDKFLGYSIPFKNVLSRGEEGQLYGYRDAKDLPNCIITKDGELPMSAGEGRQRYKNQNQDVVIDGLGIVGPSLEAYGLPKFTNEELTELADECDNWDTEFGPFIQDAEYKMRELTPEVQQLSEIPEVSDSSAVSDVVTKWNSLIEDLAGLQSLPALVMEVDHKRSIAGEQLSYDRYMAMTGRAASGKNISGGYDEIDASSAFGGRRSLYEDTTVLHDFGNHPGYRKKPFTTPANTEVDPNGAHDWNDESTKGEEPFGKQIGSSDPFEKVVDEITEAVLKQIKGGLK